MTTTAMVQVPADVLAELQNQRAASGPSFWSKAGERGKAELPHIEDAVGPVMVGGLGAMVATMPDLKNIDTVKNNWWVLPVAVIVLGYYLHRRKSDPKGPLIMAVGGALLAQAYHSRPQPPPTAQSSTPGTTAAQKSDTGDPVSAGPVQFHPISDSVGWLRMPDGRWMRVQRQAMAQPLALPPPQVTASPAAPASQDDAAASMAAAAFS